MSGFWGAKHKILLYISLVIAVFISSSIYINLLFLLFVSVLACRVPLAALKRGLIPVSFFLVFTFISNVFFQEGKVVSDFLGLQVTEQGLMRGGELTLRLFILILGAKVLTATTGAEELVVGMQGLLGPLGRRAYVKELINTMALTLRILPIVYDEAMESYRNIKNSDGKGLKDRLKLAVLLLTTLFERSLKKAEEMSEEDRVKG
ncbi:MAG: energy-coupling factor transporter transmembrane component T [Nitrospirota bacterium]